MDRWERYVNAWVGGMFRGIFFAVLGAGVCGFGVWLAFKFQGWKRWAMLIVAGIGAAMVISGLEIVVDRINNPGRF